jgi:hypothetical protein
MSELFWKLRYALILRSRTGMRLSFCWDAAGAGWETNQDFAMTPAEAVWEELSCWTE